MGFGGYEVAKAGPVGANTALARNGDAIARVMNQFLREAQSRKNGLYNTFGGQPLPRDPKWTLDTFGPNDPLIGEPLDPVRPDTQQPDMRLYEYPVSWNVTIGRERHVPWETLKRSSELPIFRACIELRKTELASMEWGIRVNPKVASRIAANTSKNRDQVSAELRQKHQDEIDRLEQWWQYPDRKNGRNFSEWIGLAIDEQLTHDALAVYPWQTYGGELLGLWIVDGATVMPLLDETGGRPAAPYPAYQQILYGFPRGEFTAQTFMDENGKIVVPGGLTQSQLVYKRRTPRTTTPYGYSATEQALLDGLLYNKRFGWMVSEYTEGVMPTQFIESDGMLDWTPEQLLDYERQFNMRMAGMTAERMRAQFLPPGLKAAQSKTAEERYRPDYDLHLIKLVAMHFSMTASELGFNDSGGLGSTGYHEGQEDINYRRGRLPDLRWFADFCTEISLSYLGMHPDLEFYFLGLESEDEAAADELIHNRVADGRMTENEGRAALGLPPYLFPEADMPMLQTARGVVFLEGASEMAPAGTLIEPMSEVNQITGPDDNISMVRTGGTQRRPLSPANAKPKSSSAAKDAELTAYRNFLSKGQRSRPFRFEHWSEVELEDLAWLPEGSYEVVKAGCGDNCGPDCDSPYHDGHREGWCRGYDLAKAGGTDPKVAGPVKNWSLYTDLP